MFYQVFIALTIKSKFSLFFIHFFAFFQSKTSSNELNLLRVWLDRRRKRRRISFEHLFTTRRKDEKRKTLFSSFHFVRYCVWHKSRAREYYQAFFLRPTMDAQRAVCFGTTKTVFVLQDARTLSHSHTHTYTHFVSLSLTQTNTYSICLSHTLAHTAFSPCSTSGGGEICSLSHAAMEEEGPLTIFRVSVDLTEREGVCVCV